MTRMVSLTPKNSQLLEMAKNIGGVKMRYTPDAAMLYNSLL